MKPALIKHNSSSEKGLTLIELLVVIGIITLIIGSIFVFYDQGFELGRRDLNQVAAQGAAARTLSDMVSEIREVSETATGAYNIEKATKQEFIFFSDPDNDNVAERIRYFLDNNELKRGTTEPVGDPLSYPLDQEAVISKCKYVVNGETPVFTYYDENYDGWINTSSLSYPPNIQEIRTVGIYLLVDTDVNHPPLATEIGTQVNLRNLKTNL